MQPKLIHIGLMGMFLTISPLLAGNPAICKKETGTPASNSVNVIITEKQSRPLMERLRGNA
jgi:hypothetical protein